MSDNRRACPPPFVRSPQTGRCVAGPRAVAPFGGPANSPWSLGPRAVGPQSKPASCVDANSDCFSSCAGTINGASPGFPGPVCGWTFIQPFGPSGGEFAFTPGVMSMDTAGATNFPIATKPLSSPLASVFGLSGQFSFSEFPTPPNGTTTYQVVLNNSILSQTLSISLFGDGSLVVEAGDTANIPTYTGAWTPNNSAHVVHFVIDITGIPTLYIDGISIALAFFGNIPSFGASYPANSISYGGGAGVAAVARSPLQRLFVSMGAFAPNTVFCCP